MRSKSRGEHPEIERFVIEVLDQPGGPGAMSIFGL